MDGVWSILEVIGNFVLWLLEKIWLLWYGTYLWLIPSVGEGMALLLVTMVPLIIVLVLLYMSIAKTQIGIEMFGHSSFRYGLMGIGVIIVVVLMLFILPKL